MLYEFGSDWIETKEPKELSIKEKAYLDKMQTIKLLKTYILNWSDDKKITTKSIKNLKYEYGLLIISDIQNELKRFQEIIIKNEQPITQIFYITFKGQKVLKHGEQFWDYIDDILYEMPYYFDHRGNILHLPQKGGIEDQSWETMKLISLAQIGIKKVMEEKANKGR